MSQGCGAFKWMRDFFSDQEDYLSQIMPEFWLRNFFKK